jgi:hypothetical protein
VSTPGQTKELKEIQERATKLGRRHDYTIRKLYHIHEQSEWNWKAANNKIRDSLKALEGNHTEDSEMKDLLNSIVHTTNVPDAVLEFWKTLIPTSAVNPATQAASQCAATVAANALLKTTTAAAAAAANASHHLTTSTGHHDAAHSHSDLVNSLTLPSPVSRTNSIARVPSFNLSRPSVSRTNSASAVFDFCKNTDAINLFAPAGSSSIVSLGRTQ